MRALRHPLVESRVLWLGAAAAVLFARFSDWLLHPRLWAEDGPVFFLNAKMGGPSVVTDPYAGYLNLIPRLIALGGSFLDPGAVPTFYCFAAFAVALAVVARTLSPRVRLAWRAALALAIVAAPGTGEVYLCPTNIQWITALALVMLVFTDDPVGVRAWAGDAAVLVLAGLTGPFSLFLMPFFVRRAFVRRTRCAWILAAVAAGAAAVQGCELVLHPPPPSEGAAHGPLNWSNLAAVFAVHVPLSLLGDQGWLLHVDRGVVIAAGAVCVACLAASIIARGTNREDRLVLILFALMLCAAATAKTRCDAWYFRETVNGDRYFYIPKVMLLWVAVGWIGDRRRPFALAGAVVLAAATAYSSTAHYRDAGDSANFHTERKFFEWQPYCADLRAGNRVVITVSPGWKFTVPDRLVPR